MKKTIAKNFHLIAGLTILLAVFSCKQKAQHEEAKSNTTDPYAPKEYVELQHPEWSKNATIYEVNVRQYTKEGTFNAFAEHLPRLKELGVDIIWLMPIHPIGEKNRKGELGSYYSVKDYYGINPEFGTEQDFRSLIKKAHDMNMRVIIDWVANHSAWDNKLTEEHPEWYTRTHDGQFQPTPWYDWDDIIDFDYKKPGIRKYMTEALKYWVKEFDIDGYRCDVAGFIPVDFWNNVRNELDAIKPVFMLAEWESRDLHKNAFDMTYAWQLYEKMHHVVKGSATMYVLYDYMAHHVNTFPRNGYRMNFVDNHDKNSWEGTPFSMFGSAVETCIVLTCTAEGMPLIYSGQEAGLDRKLAFFDKDLIEWKEHPHGEIYKKLFRLKKENKALWNGKYGGSAMPVAHNQMKSVLAFTREKDGDKLVCFFNFTNKPVEVETKGTIHTGKYTDVFTGQNIELKGADKVELPAWGYKVFSSKH